MLPDSNVESSFTEKVRSEASAAVCQERRGGNYKAKAKLQPKAGLLRAHRGKGERTTEHCVGVCREGWAELGAERPMWADRLKKENRRKTNKQQHPPHTHPCALC